MDSCEERLAHFDRYVEQYPLWREIARSLPDLIDLDAMRHAARDEAQQRRATQPERSPAERRAGA
jgi:hypothetical protein